MKLNPTQIHNLKNLITFYEEIPDEKWCQGTYENFMGQKCALGHAGVQSSSTDIKNLPIALNLIDIMQTYLKTENSNENFNVVLLEIASTNDNGKGKPKNNIVNFLRGILEKQNL